MSPAYQYRFKGLAEGQTLIYAFGFNSSPPFSFLCVQNKLTELTSAASHLLSAFSLFD